MDSHIVSMIARAAAAFAIVILSVVYARRLRRNPHRAKEHSRVQRQPRLFLVAIAAILFLGVILMSVPLFADDLTAANRIALPIAGAISLASAAGMILFYVNWGLVVGPDQVWVRTAIGRVKTIRYDQIGAHRFYFQNGHRMLKLKGADGTILHLSASHFQLGPLLDYLALIEESEDTVSGGRG